MTDCLTNETKALALVEHIWNLATSHRYGDVDVEEFGNISMSLSSSSSPISATKKKIVKRHEVVEEIRVFCNSLLSLVKGHYLETPKNDSGRFTYLEMTRFVVVYLKRKISSTILDRIQECKQTLVSHKFQRFSTITTTTPPTTICDGKTDSPLDRRIVLVNTKKRIALFL